jgi:hypothetical protein
MAVTFMYPASFKPISISSVINTVGNTKNNSIAAVGTDEVDFLSVSRSPLNVAVTAANVNQAVAVFDSRMTRLARRPVSGKPLRLDGRAAIAYPTVPVPGLSGTTSRVTYVFVGTDSYELQCQAKSSGAAAIDRACDQMLSTIKVTK